MILLAVYVFENTVTGLFKQPIDLEIFWFLI